MCSKKGCICSKKGCMCSKKGCMFSGNLINNNILSLSISIKYRVVQDIIL
jgi:hypothetical protein